MPDKALALTIRALIRYINADDREYKTLYDAAIKETRLYVTIGEILADRGQQIAI